MPEFEDQVILPCACEALFDFLARPANVARISDPTIGLRFVTAPEIVKQGDEISFEMLGMGRVVKATHRIIQCERPLIVIEEQISGPMGAWRHEHRYESTTDGTRMLDLIEFTPPGGLAGLLLTEKRILSMLDEQFYQRQQKLLRIVESELSGR